MASLNVSSQSVLLPLGLRGQALQMAELEFGVGFKMDEISWAVVVSTIKQTCARFLSQCSVSRASRVPKPGDYKGRKMDDDDGRRRLGRTCAGTLVESALFAFSSSQEKS